MPLQPKLLILKHFAALHLHINLTGKMALASSWGMILGLFPSDPALATRYMVMIKNETLIRMGIGEKLASIADSAPPNQGLRGVANAKRSCGIFPHKEKNV
ncbi:MAG: hypothetical protein AMK69_05170 [Nitrospira bacterium SG8_3]|nr:MAG: hypothetical protein AMK69_05170 [Nitrospira bacterium SG8_3]